MKYNFFKGVIASLALAISGFANAGLIVDQSFDSSNIISGANFSQGSNSQFDNFTLTESFDIDLISMWGGYWSSGVQPSSFDFRMQIRTDTSFASVIFDQTLIASAVFDTGYDHNNNGTADILKFDFDVTGLTLGAGSYYIGISSQNNPGTSFYRQQLSTPYVSGVAFNGTVGSTSGDLTLAINGSTTSVPEPSTLAIFALGMIGLASRRFKKQS
tara:strand:- start:252 stop:896 length:645 start_codon:yes stop_codon:yes gene_type:complete